MVLVGETVRIRITAKPPYICLAQRRHHNKFLEAFVGLELQAVPDPEDNTSYLVTVGEVEHFLRQKTDVDVAKTYWIWYWLQTQHLLSDPVYFPKGCCEVIEE